MREEMRNSRLTIDDILGLAPVEKFDLGQGKKGKGTIKKRKIKLPTELEYPVFFALVKDNPYIENPECEYKFHPTRKWRVDICWPDQKLAVEIEGAVWTGGRHVHPTGFVKDMEKYNTLSLMGYHLLRFTPQQMILNEAYPVILQWFKNNAKK